MNWLTKDCGFHRLGGGGEEEEEEEGRGEERGGEKGARIWGRILNAYNSETVRARPNQYGTLSY